MAGVEVMVRSEGLVLGSVHGFLGALRGEKGGVGPWGHLGVRGRIWGQRSQRVRGHRGSEVTGGSEGLVLGSVDGFLGVLWGAEGEVGLGVSWRSEVTSGVRGHGGGRGHREDQRSW